MFYKQFSRITDILNPEFVENFDYWLATLPTNNQKNITASVVSSRLGVKYSLAETILNFAYKEKILERYYLVKCPDCDYNLAVIAKDEIANALVDPVFCEECEEYKHISVGDIYIAYKVILAPDVTEDEIEREIKKRLNQGDFVEVNFSNADSLLNNKKTLYEVFYNPSESAYNEFKVLRDRLDLDYGKDTTAKGNALEELVLRIFKCIEMVKGTNKVKTHTNQFDCTMISGANTVSLSVLTYLAPYFIIECKNEPNNKPNNTYCNKLLSIMDTNASQLGIIVGRIDATSTCFEISREHYLLHSQSNKQRIIITLSDDDLKLIIDDRVNLLEYLEFKIFQVTSNSPNSKFEMFE